MGRILGSWSSVFPGGAVTRGGAPSVVESGSGCASVGVVIVAVSTVGVGVVAGDFCEGRDSSEASLATGTFVSSLVSRTLATAGESSALGTCLSLITSGNFLLNTGICIDGSSTFESAASRGSTIFGFSTVNGAFAEIPVS